MTKANFGVQVELDSETVGRVEVGGVGLSAESTSHPIEVQGSAESLSVLINDRTVDLPSSGVQLRHRAVKDIVKLDGGSLAEPIRFELSVEAPPESPDGMRWTLETGEALMADSVRPSTFARARAGARAAEGGESIGALSDCRRSSTRRPLIRGRRIPPCCDHRGTSFFSLLVQPSGLGGI